MYRFPPRRPAEKSTRLHSSDRPISYAAVCLTPHLSSTAAPSPSASARPRRLLISFVPPPPRRFTFFPYTTLFRSRRNFEEGEWETLGGAVEQIFGSHLTSALLIPRREGWYHVPIPTAPTG